MPGVALVLLDEILGIAVVPIHVDGEPSACISLRGAVQADDPVGGEVLVEQGVIDGAFGRATPGSSSRVQVISAVSVVAVDHPLQGPGRKSVGVHLPGSALRDRLDGLMVADHSVITLTYKCSCIPIGSSAR